MRVDLYLLWMFWWFWTLISDVEWILNLHAHLLFFLFLCLSKTLKIKVEIMFGSKRMRERGYLWERTERVKWDSHVPFPYFFFILHLLSSAQRGILLSLTTADPLALTKDPMQGPLTPCHSPPLFTFGSRWWSSGILINAQDESKFFDSLGLIDPL